jgi:methylated-DNA-protein-cysteine methyltransferase-like protein
MNDIHSSPTLHALRIVLATIPAGQVASYGYIARQIGHPRHARWVGQELGKLPNNTRLPWHRVVSAAGALTCPDAHTARQRLLSEGIEFRGSKVLRRAPQWLG